MRLKYAERLGISQSMVDEEPIEYVEKAFVMWPLLAHRAKLDLERERNKAT